MCPLATPSAPTTVKCIRSLQSQSRNDLRRRMPPWQMQCRPRPDSRLRHRLCGKLRAVFPDLTDSSLHMQGIHLFQQLHHLARYIPAYARMARKHIPQISLYYFFTFMLIYYHNFLCPVKVQLPFDALLMPFTLSHY